MRGTPSRGVKICIRLAVISRNRPPQQLLGPLRRKYLFLPGTKVSRFFTMNKLLIVLLSFVLLSSCKKKTDAEIIAGIRKDCQEINRNLKEDSKKQVDDLISASGRTITGYYNGDDIRKIYSESYTDTNRVFTTYYFDQEFSGSADDLLNIFSERLIYAEEEDFIYIRSQKYTEEVARAHNDSVWYDDKKTRMVQDQYFFKSNKLIKWMVDDKEVPANTQVFIDRESAIWAQSALFLKELKEQ